MNERICELRKKLGLTQEKFAAQIGLSKNFIWMIEKGERIPSDRTIADICREFHVSENWLRTGEGEPFSEPGGEVITLIDQIMRGENKTAKALFKAFARLDENQWKTIQQIIDDVTSDRKQ